MSNTDEKRQMLPHQTMPKDSEQSQNNSIKKPPKTCHIEPQAKQDHPTLAQHHPVYDDMTIFMRRGKRRVISGELFQIF